MIGPRVCGLTLQGLQLRGILLTRKGLLPDVKIWGFTSHLRVLQKPIYFMHWLGNGPGIPQSLHLHATLATAESPQVSQSRRVGTRLSPPPGCAPTLPTPFINCLNSALFLCASRCSRHFKSVYPSYEGSAVICPLYK